MVILMASRFGKGRNVQPGTGGLDLWLKKRRHSRWLLGRARTEVGRPMTGSLWIVERTYINFKFPNQFEWAKAR